MKAEYRDDPGRGPGNGILVFSETLVPDGPWNVAIQRSTDHNYATGLDGNRWVGEIIFFPLQGEVGADGSLNLFAGPELVDSLDPMEIYKITLKGEDGGEHKTGLTINTITHSQRDSLGNTARPEAAPEEPKPAAPPPQPPRTPEPEPVAPPRPEPVREPLSEPLPAPEPAPQATSAKKYWKYAIAALLALLCVGWYFWDKSRPKEENQPAVAQGEQQPAPQAPPAKQLSAAEQVARFFAGNDKTPEAAIKLFENLPKNDDADKDAAYRLLYFAAENGDGQALLEYAKCLDPSRPQWGTIEKDATLALNAYSQAAKAGVPGAEDEQAALQAWLENRGKGGNLKAGQGVGGVK